MNLVTGARAMKPSQRSIIESSAAEHHQLDVVAAENRKRLPIEPVVDERAHRVGASGKHRGLRPQPRLEPGQPMPPPVSCVRCIEKLRS
jgi:hypothetical protein